MIRCVLFVFTNRLDGPVQSAVDNLMKSSDLINNILLVRNQLPKTPEKDVETYKNIPIVNITADSL